MRAAVAAFQHLAGIGGVVGVEAVAAVDGQHQPRGSSRPRGSSPPRGSSRQRQQSRRVAARDRQGALHPPAVPAVAAGEQLGGEPGGQVHGARVAGIDREEAAVHARPGGRPALPGGAGLPGAHHLVRRVPGHLRARGSVIGNSNLVDARRTVRQSGPPPLRRRCALVQRCRRPVPAAVRPGHQDSRCDSQRGRTVDVGGGSGWRGVGGGIHREPASGRAVQRPARSSTGPALLAARRPGERVLRDRSPPHRAARRYGGQRRAGLRRAGCRTASRESPRHMPPQPPRRRRATTVVACPFRAPCVPLQVSPRSMP